MNITSDILNFIISEVPIQKKEMGGLLGYDKNRTIVSTILDRGLHKDTHDYTYYPNIPLFNKTISEWAENDISFAGIFHTHYSDQADLSTADIIYIEKILLSLPKEIDVLFFPLLLIPSKAFIPFEAIIDEKGTIHIREDRLIILK